MLGSGTYAKRTSPGFWMYHNEAPTATINPPRLRLTPEPEPFFPPEDDDDSPEIVDEDVFVQEDELD